MDKRLLVVVAVAGVVAFFGFYPGQSSQHSVEFQAQGGPVIVPVEIADSNEERIQGLMFRESLDGGMLFIFEQDQVLGFWMKNTPIPLDMIFISKDLEIVNIHEADPCEQDPCPSFSSEVPALYVVEVNQGFSEQHNLKKGDKVKLYL